MKRALSLFLFFTLLIPIGHSATVRYCDLVDQYTQIGLGFDGSTNSYVNIPASTSINNLVANDFSIAMWVFVTSADANGRGFWEKSVNSSASSNIGWYVASGAGFNVNGRIMNTVGGMFQSAGSTVYNFNTWYQIVWTYSNSGDRKVHIYVNGTETGYSTQQAVTGTVDSDSNSDLRIGGGTLTTTSVIGRIDEVMIFSKILTPAQITLLYYPFTPGTQGMGLYGDISVYPCNAHFVLGMHMDENTGTSIADYSLNGNTGTAGSACAWVSGKVYKGMVTQASAVLNTTTTNFYKTGLSLAGNLTLSTWFKVYFTGSASDKAITDLSTDGATGLYAYVVGATKYLKIDINGTNVYTGGVALTDGNWHNLVFTRTGSTVEYWLDGVSLGTTGSISTTFTRLYCNGKYNNSVNSYGYTDEINLWSRKLTNGEVTDLYNTGTGMYYYPADVFPSSSTTMATNIVLAYHLDDNAVNTVDAITDSSANGNHGTQTSMAAGNWVTVTVLGNLGLAVTSAQTWNTARVRLNMFDAQGVYPGDTIRIAKTPDPVGITSGGNAVNGVFTGTANGLANGNTAFRKTITGATNASPIVITCAGHGFQNGDWVFISGITGNTSANGMWKVVNKATDTFELLNSKGNGARTGGGTVQDVNSRVIPLNTSISYNLPRMRKAFWTQGSGITLTDTTHMKSGASLTGTVNVAGAQTIAYVDLGGTFDFSAYQTVNWDMYVQTAFVADKIQLVFCSDTAGATPIANGTVSHPGSESTTAWIKKTIYQRNPLPSGVKSIAIKSTGAVNLGTIYLDTIWLSKPTTATDHISGQSAIGISSDINTIFYPIDQIVDDTILIGVAKQVYASSGGACWGWHGTSGTYQIYRREALIFNGLALWHDYPGYINVPGTAGNLINWEGGWDKSSNTRNGETWVSSPTNGTTYLLINSIGYTKLSRLNMFSFNGGLSMGTSSNGDISLIATGCSTGYSTTGNDNTIAIQAPNNSVAISIAGNNHILKKLGGTEIDLTNSTGTTGADFSSPKNMYVADNINASNALGSGVSFGNTVSQCRFKDITANYCVSVGMTTSVTNKVSIDNLTLNYNYWGQIVNGTGKGGAFSYMSESYIKNLNITNIGGYLSYGGEGASFTGCSNVYIGGGYTNGGYYSALNLTSSTILFKNFTFDNTLVNKYAFTGTNDGSRVYSESEAGVWGTNKIYSPIGLIITATDQRHTASGASFKMSPTSLLATADMPLEISLGKFPLVGGVNNTIYAWMRRDNTGITGSLFVKAREADGLTVDTTSSTVGNANEWERVSITLNPTHDSAVEVFARAYGGTSYNLWVDDINGDTKDRIYWASPFYSANSESSYTWGG